MSQVEYHANLRCVEIEVTFCLEFHDKCGEDEWEASNAFLQATSVMIPPYKTSGNTACMNPMIIAAMHMFSPFQNVIPHIRSPFASAMSGHENVST